METSIANHNLMDREPAAIGPVPATQSALDYERIEKAIRYLQAHFLEQPDLAAVARAAHVSEHHFQRVFARWAGLSPKRFLQFLTLEHAKAQLAESKPVLDTALDSGLSSPGRLHDLFVTAEAVTPGEFKQRGEGLQISYGFHPTRFGECLIGVTSRGICQLSFVSGGGQRRALADMKAHWVSASFVEQPEVTGPTVEQVFSDLERRDGSPLHLLLKGTNFQIKVWQALLGIPTGAVSTYEAIGGLIGAPAAFRAIGAAVGQNPIAYLIPCHRVIRKNGVLGGYHWGAARKQAILGWEAAITATAATHRDGRFAVRKPAGRLRGTLHLRERACCIGPTLQRV
jgi:AraC family transcriptional regulator of adaptative response/methylated-DNA-[protein]-cysteine methyltransferase